MDRGGLVGADGATHCGAFDITYMATLPNMIVMAPSDEAELIHMVRLWVQSTLQQQQAWTSSTPSCLEDLERLLQKRLRCSKLHLCQRRLLLLPRSLALAVARAAAAVEAVQVSCIRAACLLLLLLLLLPPHMFRQTAEWLACHLVTWCHLVTCMMCWPPALCDAAVGA